MGKNGFVKQIFPSFVIFHSLMEGCKLHEGRNNHLWFSCAFKKPCALLMNELWVVRRHWKTLKVGSRIWDAQKHGLERWLWQQPDRWTTTGESISRGIHKLVGVMVQGFAEKMERKNLMTEFCVRKSLFLVDMAQWGGNVGRDEEELSAWANGSMMIVFSRWNSGGGLMDMLSVRHPNVSRWDLDRQWWEIG